MPSDKAVLYDPNRRAAASVRDRTRVLREVYDTLLPEMKARAFAVTGIEDMKSLGRVQEAVSKIPEGGDWKAARKQIATELTEQWAATSGGVDPANLAEAATRRAETILKTNVFQAYATSRYAEQQAFKEDFPYLQYITRGDSHTRASHAALDGKIFPIDDPFWKDHYPPWEFGCRCIVVGLTIEEAEAKGVMTGKDKDDFERNFPGAGADGSYHFNPGELNIPLTDIVEGKDPEQAAYFAGSAIDNRVTMPDGAEQSVWRWTLDIKPGLEGATAAAKTHVADKLSLDGIAEGDLGRIEALNKATESFSAARVALKLPKIPELQTTYDKDTYAKVISSPDGSPLAMAFNPDEFQRLEETFQHNVTDRLAAGKVRYSAIPSAAEAAKSIALHEFGHITFNAAKLKDKDIKLLRVYQRAVESGDIDAVSEYARRKKHGREFFAEVFAMWKNGEHLPDYIVNLIKEVLA